MTFHETITFVFSPASAFWGELVTLNGAMQQIHLSPMGEMDIGHVVEEWQTQGVPFARERTQKTPSGPQFLLVEERVQLRHPAFLTAFRHWTVTQRAQVVAVPPHALVCWEKISRLPLTDDERCHFFSTFCIQPESEVVSWMTAVDDALRAVDAVSV